METHKDGHRVRYFGDDDRYDLQQMYEREKMNTAEDQNALLSNMAAKSHDKLNDDFDMDDMLVSRAAAKKDENVEEAKLKNRVAVQQASYGVHGENSVFGCAGTHEHGR